MAAASNYINEIANLIENSVGDSSLPHFSEESLSVLYSMAYELYRNGKYQDAKGFFRFLTLANSFERKHWMGLAACYQMLKCYSEAIECYSVAALQNASDPYVHWHVADCFFHSGKFIEAVHALDSAIVVAKENNIYSTLAPKLALIADTWSSLSKGVLHD